LSIHSATDKTIIHGNSSNVKEAQSSYLGRTVRLISRGDRNTGLEHLAKILKETAEVIRDVKEEAVDEVPCFGHFESLGHNYFRDDLQAEVLVKVSHLQLILNGAIDQHIELHGERPASSEQYERNQMINMSNQFAILLENFKMTQESIQSAQAQFMGGGEVGKKDCDLVLADAYDWLGKKLTEALKSDDMPFIKDPALAVPSRFLSAAGRYKDDKGSLSTDEVKKVFEETEREIAREKSIAAGVAARSAQPNMITPVLTEWRGYMRTMRLKD
jgi:hypothetical protein